MTGLIRTAAGGRIVTNYGTTVLPNNTVATRNITVPAGRRWYLYGGQVYNGDSVARNISVYVTDSGGNFLVQFVSLAALTTLNRLVYPNGVVAALALQSLGPLPLSAGDIIVITWAAGGASAGGTATSTAIVLEVPA